MNRNGKTIQSLERGFIILETLSLAEAPLPLQAIAKSVDLPKTTVHGLLSTLVNLGYVERKGQAYVLGLRLRELSKPLEQKDESIRHHFFPLLQRMAQFSNSTAYLAIQSGTNEYIYVDAIENDNSLSIRSPRGRRESLIDSAIGKIFVAFNPLLRKNLRVQCAFSSSLDRELDQIIKQGFALDLGHAEPELNCLALPLYINGELVAAAGLSGNEEDLSEDKLRHFARVFLK
ncbi:TPA: IclR family transcriptional regulator [Vibrio vulnificus]|uniref:IclR family transcriptional regulator n=1 Tax=Vibrio TaxID=662 RepID=UPI00111DDCDD|nr:MULTISPECIES: IclR family transcriptional regulator [Vibrio]HDY7637819.1 IclR family transcriptional regulator [Vibrio vulnificus]MBE4295547.1 IclR family transcriptional regulator [Vibrio parahaemolyticus]MDV6253530.1 IclR family transcriptional regulator [Vibrio sp. EA2]TOG36847.1 transcriptional regulator [Vibrio parahaemolyticus]HCM1552963.1 IclR family transcriptional regulator [Vibrio parahaemolyticus]